MYEVPKGLLFAPLGVRVRLLAEAPANALATRREWIAAIDVYFSEFRRPFFSGEIKRVGNYLNAKRHAIHCSFSLVAAEPEKKLILADRHRREFRNEIAAQYKTAVIRYASDNPKNTRHLRERFNRQHRPEKFEPDQVDIFFAEYPAALVSAKPIADLWRSAGSV